MPMEEPRKHQVSLRGASAKEISRDALLEKVSQEREQRSYARRAAASAIFIQRVWRRHNVTRKMALQLQKEWESLLETSYSVTAKWVSDRLLRPFLFFTQYLSIFHRKIEPREMSCIHSCLKILLESTSSTDSEKNFCCLAAGTYEERRTWTYQTKGIIILCSFILAECDSSPGRNQEIVTLTLLALRLLVMLTDLKAWMIVTDSNRQNVIVAVNDLVCFMCTIRSGLYLSIRKYISKLDASFSSKLNNIVQTDDRFFISASVITLAIRPFNAMSFQSIAPSQFQAHDAVEQYCLFLLTIPWLLQRLPVVLLPALKHRSVLAPCMRTLLISREKIFMKMLDIDQSKVNSAEKVIPSVGWALANIISLAAGSENDFTNPGGFIPDHLDYVRTVILLAKNLLTLLDAVWNGKANKDPRSEIEASMGYSSILDDETNSTCGSIEMSYLNQYRPICQQWHLKRLLGCCNDTDDTDGVSTEPKDIVDYSEKLRLLDVAYFYSLLLRVSSAFNPRIGSMHVLNTLSFNTGFLSKLWEVLESYFFPGLDTAKYNVSDESNVSQKKRVVGKKLKQTSKDGISKWVNVMHKFVGKSQSDIDHADTVEEQQVDSCPYDVWDIERLRHGPKAISSDISCMLHLFSATYSHLLLVLDDIKFYEKQVPFTLDQQRKIASMLNTFVYNCFSHTMSQENIPLVDSATRCLHLMYERDCRHQFCPPILWLAPATKSRPPIALAARTHEALSANMRSDTASAVYSMRSVITVVPHVYPFEERVQIFREFINMDKSTRKMAAGVAAPGSRSVEIVVRRSHIVEDGFRQLNSLGSRLKSSIHVSFVSECGLPEAGLDYGGLSKEFLTDISKAAFSPEYRFFTQTSTSDRLLMPNAAARYLDNGVQMIEFLGRVVGKALYEGILLDYSFSHVFVQKLLGRYSFLDELSTLDPELYRNLMFVKHYDGDVKDLSFDFTITEESFGKRHIIELKPGGKDICVTDENKMQYIHAIADYKLNLQIRPFSNAFYRGLTDLISPSWLRLFNAAEFNQLLSGGNFDIDVDDLRINTQYTGGYSERSKTIMIFWEVMKVFEPKERCMVLKFVTSCSRAPLLGFKYLQPSFTIHKVGGDTPLWAAIGGQDVERLPSASTCYNTLKLPTYKRSSTLRAKLLYAINSNAGFELS